MHPELNGLLPTLGVTDSLLEWLTNGWLFLKVLIGFSIIIFVHELGHFLAARWMGVRVDRFAIGFFYRVCGWRRGEGFTFGRRPEYSAEELKAKGYGETDYCLNALPFGGYVKMLGQDDIIINEETGEVKTSDDPRSFTNKPVGRRMVVVSAGVVFNVLFAILAFMLVFLASGRRVIAPVVGVVDPGSPAAVAGVLPGDRIRAIDGEETESFHDILMATMLAEEPIRLRIERGGELLPEELVVDVQSGGEQDRPIGILPPFNAVVAPNPLVSPDDSGPQPGDRLIEVNGQGLTHPDTQLVDAFRRSRGKPVQFTVERPSPDSAGESTTVSCSLPPILIIEPSASPAATRSELLSSQSLLGMQRRQLVLEVLPGAAAEKAGFKAGDAIAQWGTVANPLRSDVFDSIDANPGRPVPVIVEREGALVELTVTPRRKFSLFGGGKPMVGLVFGYDQRPVVADILRGSPADELGMPRGSLIVAINSQPVDDWYDVNEALRDAAGTTATVRFRSGGDEVERQMRVPSSIVNELGLPPTATILSIDGHRHAELPSGQRVPLLSAWAVRRLLEQNVGRTVKVEYVEESSNPQSKSASFAVREDNTDPWQLRAYYSWERQQLQREPKTARIDAGGNPLRAFVMAWSETGKTFGKMYKVVRGMLSPRSQVGVDSMAGPVGIFQLAMHQAESGYEDLLYFLAFISINLAVINFLPFPVVDGGLMVFLLLEKIRGKPLSIKVQVTTTLIGLALIVGVFLFVTVQDLSRWWSGGI